MRYLEDYAAGQRYAGPARLRVDAERIRSFAAEFDPQPFHLDDAAAQQSIFRGLAASGWHTAAMTMHLLWRAIFSPPAESSAPASTNSAGRCRCGQATSYAWRWRCSTCGSRNRPGIGIVKIRTSTLNQDGAPVQVTVGNLVVPKRATG